jgi:hypothetical protein
MLKNMPENTFRSRIRQHCAERRKQICGNHMKIPFDFDHACNYRIMDIKMQ